MTTDAQAPDELEVPHLKARLRHELAELHHGQLRHGQRRRRSRSGRLHAVLTAAAAVMIVGLVAAQLVGTSSETPLMGRIVAATDEASASSIIHWSDEQTRPGEARPSRVTENWTDETSDATRMRIQFHDEEHDLNFDAGPLTGPTVDSPAHSGQRVVNYCTGHYVDHIDTGGASTDVDADVLVELRDEVAAGQLIEDGTEVFEGRELIRLISDEPAPGSDVVLVDPDTYLPVSARGTLDSGATFSQTYEYLPRTAANLALLLPPIPDGFTLIDPVTPGADLDGCAS
jgi:hypothetical protein